MNRSSLTGAIVASLLLTPLVTAQTETHEAPPTRAERFVEVPGQMEFRGVLTALPLQLEDAERFGLTEAEILERRAAAEAALSAYPLVEYVSATDETLIEVGLGNEQAVADQLMAEGTFRYVEPDWTVYPLANCTNDPLLSNQWHHNANRVNSCAGWNINTGDPSVTVAVCDTGIRTTHTEFQLHRKEGYNAVDQQWENSGGKINDLHGHGTGTTGCAAANGDNGAGISGMGWDLSHRMMRVSNQSSGSSTLSILNHAARTASDAGDRSINISYSGVTASTNQTTGGYVRNQGGLVVWAAGNSGSNLSGNRDDDLIVVIATSSSDTKPSFSNFGSFCDLSAPGVDVFTTSASGNNAYGGASGTSFAAPLTAGVVAMIFATDPSLTPQQAEDILRAGCDDLGQNGVDNTYGYGRIDLGQTLALIQSCGVDNYCTAQNNSTGVPAQMKWTGSASIFVNDLTLFVDAAPADVFGLFFHGDKQLNKSSGSGTLCVGGNLGRYPVQKTDLFGSASQAVDVTDPPNSGAFMVGEKTYFSFWFRDGPGNWNFADGLAVEWCD